MAEMLDIYDEDGIHLGVKDRDSVHRDGDWHKTSQVWIVNGKGELLFQKRSFEKDVYPGRWDISSAGHVSAGDEMLESAEREVYEELGLHIKADQLTHVFTNAEKHYIEDDDKIDAEISHVFILFADYSLEEFNPVDGEVIGLRYIHYSEVLKEVADKPDEFVPHEGHYQSIVEIVKERYS